MPRSKKASRVVDFSSIYDGFILRILTAEEKRHIISLYNKKIAELNNKRADTPGRDPGQLTEEQENMMVRFSERLKFIVEKL